LALGQQGMGPALVARWPSRYKQQDWTIMRGRNGLRAEYCLIPRLPPHGRTRTDMDGHGRTRTDMDKA
jgi:hypothetical protein